MPRAISVLFLSLLITAPLAFGTTELWSFIALQCLCLLIFSQLLWRSLKRREPFYQAPGSLLLLLLGSFLVFQMIPLPPLLLQQISPATWRLYEQTVWAVSPNVWMPLSVNIKETALEFARLGTYGIFYLLAVQVMSERERLKWVVHGVCIFVAGFSLLGILQYLLPSGKLFWLLRDWPERTSHHFASYVNGNHYAGLMEMVLPVVLCLFLATRPQVRYGSWRERLVETFGNPRGNRHVLYGVTALLVAASIFLSLSRGGILSTLTALLALSLFLLLRGRDRKAGIWLLLLLTGMLLTVGVVGWGPIFDRFERMRTVEGDLVDERLVYWQDSLELVRRFPLTGTGFGSFIDVYPSVKTAKTQLTVDHAHNDYVELATDGGLVSLLLVAGFYGVVIRRVLPAWRRRQSRQSSFLVLGSLTGLVAIGLHSMTDFNLHIGANALYLFWLLALAVAASHNRSGGKSLSELPRTSLRRTVLGGTLLAAGLLAALLFNLGVLTAQRGFASVEKVDLAQVETASERQDIRSVAAFAARWDPLERRYRYALANADLSLGFVTRGLEHYAQALRLGPVRGEYLERIGLVYARLNRPAKAQQLLRAAVSVDVTDPRRYLSLAAVLLQEQETEAAYEVTRRLLSFAPEQTRDVLLLLILQQVADADMVQALPERARAYQEYGDYLLERDNAPGAEAAFAHALHLFESEEDPGLHVIWRLRTYFLGKKAYQEALQVVQAGLKHQPEHAGLRRAAGELYERLGIPYRALEEYRHSLLLEPGHKGARKRVDVLSRGQ